MRFLFYFHCFDSDFFLYPPSFVHFVGFISFVQNHAHVAECPYCLSETVLDRMFMNNFGGQIGPDDAWRPAVLTRIREVLLISLSYLRYCPLLLFHDYLAFFFSKKIPETFHPWLKRFLMDKPLGSMLVLALRHLLARYLVPLVVPTGKLTLPRRIHLQARNHALLQRSAAPLEFAHGHPLGFQRRPLSPILLVALSSLSSNTSAAP